MADISVGSVFVDVVPNMAKFTSALGAQADSAAGRLSAGLASAGKTATRYLTVPILGAAAASTKMALDFNQAFVRIQTLAGNTGLSITQMQSQVKSLAAATGQDPTGLANALYQVASAGKVAASQAMPILTEAAKGAALGMGDVNDIATVLTSTMNAYGPKTISASQAMDTLTQATHDSAAEAGDLAGAIGPVIGVAAQVGVSFQDVAAAIATATNQGISAERAATGLRYLLQSLAAPTQAAQQKLQQYGISSQDLQRMLSKEGLQGTLQDLAKTFDLTSTRGQQAWKAVVGGARGAVIANTQVGHSASAAAGEVKKLGDTAGVTQQKFEVWGRSITGQNAKALSDLKVAAINLGEQLIPIFEHVVSAVSDVAKWFSGLSNGTQDFIVKALGVTALIGPFLRLGGVIAGIVAKFGQLGGAAASGAGAASLSGAAAALTEAAGAISAAAAELAAAGASAGADITAGGTTASTELTASQTSGAVLLGGEGTAIGGGAAAGKQLAQSGTESGSLFGTLFLGAAGAALNQGGPVLIEKANTAITGSSAWGKFAGDLGQGVLNIIQGLPVNFPNPFRDVPKNPPPVFQQTAQQVKNLGIQFTGTQKATLQAAIDSGHYAKAVTIMRGAITHANAALKGQGVATMQDLRSVNQYRSGLLGSSKAAQNMGKWININNGLTQDQKTQLAGTIGSIYKYGGSLNKAKQAAFDAAVADGNFSAAQKILNNAINAMPARKQVKIEADTSQASAGIRTIQGQINGLHGKTIPINVVYSTTGTPPSNRSGVTGGAQFAAGAVIRGQAGFITQGPMFQFGEGSYPTPWGKGAEAVTPLDRRGIGILGEALDAADTRRARKRGGDGNMGPLRIEGKLEIVNGEAYIRGVARQELDDDHRYSAALARR